MSVRGICVACKEKKKKLFFSQKPSTVRSYWACSSLGPCGDKGWGQSSCQSVYIYSFLGWKVIQGETTIVYQLQGCWCESVAHSNRQDWHWASDFSDEWTLQGSLWMLLHILSPLSIFSLLLLLSWQLLLITMAQDKEQLILPFTCVC